jgi:hypothetical protein
VSWLGDGSSKGSIQNLADPDHTTFTTNGGDYHEVMVSTPLGSVLVLVVAASSRTIWMCAEQHAVADTTPLSPLMESSDSCQQFCSCVGLSVVLFVDVLVIHDC